MSESSDPHPWRKRHPVLSRVLLFGAGGGLAALMLLLLQQRQAEDRLTELRGLVAAFDLLLVLDSGPDQVLEQIERELGDPDLPLDLRIAAERYTAMALRQKARHSEDGEALWEQVHAAFGAGLRLAGDRDTRNGLLLEWAEAYLEQGDALGAREALSKGDFGTQGPWALLRDQYLAIAEAAELGPEAGAERLERILAAWTAPLALEPRVEVGGRRWNLPQAATVTTERLARIYAQLGRDPLPLWRRLSDLVEKDAREQVLCCKALVALGALEDARRAWARAVAADPQEAETWLENDRSLQRLTGEG